MKNAFKLFSFMGTPVYVKYWFFIWMLFGIEQFVSIFIAILIHELAHAHMAKKRNVFVNHVLLDFLTGSASIEMDRLSYKDTILISVVGPLSNLVLSGVAYFLITNCIDASKFLTTFMSINFILFAFNILPIFPMDGGRISKALLQMVTKPSLGRKINGYLSIFTSLLLIAFAVYMNMLILGFFSVFFIFIGYTEIKLKY